MTLATKQNAKRITSEIFSDESEQYPIAHITTALETKLTKLVTLNITSVFFAHLKSESSLKLAKRIACYSLEKFIVPFNNC